MAAVKELLRAENDGSLSFGDYTLSEKTKKDNYEFEGDRQLFCLLLFLLSFFVSAYTGESNQGKHLDRSLRFARC